MSFVEDSTVSFIFSQSFDSIGYSSECLLETPYTIFNSTESLIEHKESLFVNHLLPKVSEKEIIRDFILIPDWVFFLLLGIVLLLCVIVRIAPYGMKGRIVASYAIQDLNYSSEKTFGRILETFLYIACLGLLCFWLFRYYSIDLDFPVTGLFALFAFLLGIWGVLLIVKFGLVTILGYIFEGKEIVKKYIRNMLNYNFIISSALLLFLFLLFFSNPVLWQVELNLVYGTLAFLFFLRIMTGFRILLFESKFSKPYLFYYLCIIEILPILVLAKYLI